MKINKRVFFWCFLAAMGGLCCIIVPPYVIPNGIKSTYPTSLFPVFATAVENLAFLPTAICFFGLGFFLGLAQPARWLILGWATIFAPPILAISDIIVYPTSHNLWPLEFILYGIINAPSLFGSFLGSRLRNVKKNGPEPGQ